MAGNLVSVSLRKMFVCFALFILLGDASGRDTGGPQEACTPLTGCLEGWEAPRPECVDFRCQCPNGTCSVITRTVGSAHYSYYCGTCGTMGSACANSSAECQGGARCNGGYCVCDGGSIYREVCVKEVPVPTSTNSLVLILVLVFLLILNKLISSRDTLKKCFCRRRSSEEEETTVVGFNPQSSEKSAAFTITNSEFMAVSNDPDLDWALELSRQLSRRGEDWITLGESTWSSNWSSGASGVDLEMLRARLGSRPRTREVEVEEEEVLGATASSSTRWSASANATAPSARSSLQAERGAEVLKVILGPKGSYSRPSYSAGVLPSRTRLTSPPLSSRLNNITQMGTNGWSCYAHVGQSVTREDLDSKVIYQVTD
ncbi:uncharacterized protein LOC125035246 [Penaeus chinensis]|uniref:uncharacterized protein LOC125035246 n=1 Tax=Penaeus chinensis TaxID=139456 RepID=UPI001FB804E8|nr:uncharacterized protein LOC125035246 [Penaeus chinensis]